jgi:thiamine biosynthesis lipoprotein
MGTVHRRAVVAAVLLFLILMLVSCRKPAASVQVRSEAFYGYFDTVSQVSSYAGDTVQRFGENAEAVREVLEHWHRLLDIYHEYEGMNNLCTVNRLAGGAPVEVDPDLIGFILYAERMCALTEGEMDISLGAVLSLWHEARNSEVPYLPAEEELQEAGRHVGFGNVEIDERNSTIRLTDPASSLDPGALGKGYAAEKAAQMLISKGVTGYALNLGGNVRCIGTKADGSSWRTGIRDPENPDSIVVTISMADCSCVTSGSYERYFTVDGVRYSHIIDKDTLRPATGFSSVSVVCQDSALADALTTALFCMGYEEGLELVSSLEGVDALWISGDGTLRYTKGLGPAIL